VTDSPSNKRENIVLSTELLDRSLHAKAAQLTGGLSPAALTGAYMDWLVHLAYSPGKRIALSQGAMQNAMRLALYTAKCAIREDEPAPCFPALPQDHRFDPASWNRWPFNIVAQSFLMLEQNWREATTAIAGVTAQHESLVSFFARQFLDMYAPSNFLATNPDLIARSASTCGINFIDGFRNLMEDWSREVQHLKPFGTDRFRVGHEVAATAGQVVYRNALIELIQYEPITEMVRPEPMLIVPAWIMKFYILDLSPENSLVKFLVGQGFTVFMISWKNPGEADRDLGLEDYRSLGPMAALDVIAKVAPGRKVHAVGYCLGGTLMSIAAAAMARDRDDRLRSLSLFAAQIDFTEMGELRIFINESQLAFLDDLMWEQGYLKASQMAAAFQMLRSNDLVWSYALKNYLMGEREPMNDLMAWNADATRMPHKMHSEYLRLLILENQLAEGRFPADGRPVALNDIRIPIFAVGTERDHVAPWRSTFKIHLLTDAEVTYVLTSGGHNAGIVSEPGHFGRSFRLRVKAPEDRYLDPDAWLEATERMDGSWWPAWADWLKARSGAMSATPPMGCVEGGLPALIEAPGAYVLEA
jgi:polyhydroxyalkanoate synthase